MTIYKSAINKPITTALIFIAVVVLGLYSLNTLPVDQYPDMDAPYVTVITSYPGANASELETNVTKIIENSLNSVDGLNEITSQTKDNTSIITMEFNWGGNIDEAVNDVRSALDLVLDRLPDDCSRPIVVKMSSSMFPVAMYVFTAKESYPGLYRILDDNVVNVLNRVDGIGSLTLNGAPDRHVYVDINPKKLESYNISLETVGNVIKNNNLNLASGTVKMGNEQYAVSVKSEFLSSDEIKKLVVTSTPEGKKVFIKDIATVRDTIKDMVFQQKSLSQDAVALMVNKQSGANSVKICEEVDAKMDKIMSTLPADVEVHKIMSSSDNILKSINGLKDSIFYAFIFVVLVVLFFLGDFRSTTIIALAIPISLLCAFIYLAFVGSSVNIISLASLTVAIGMVVDDAIVVLENINKHISRNENPREASIYGTNEVWVSVIATTMVTVAVFVPLTMLGGQAGILFKELGWIVTIVVCVSTTIAISLIPMLSSKLLKKHKVLIDKKGNLIELTKQDSKYSYKNTIGKFLDKMDAWYSGALGFCLRHKRATLFTALGIFLLSLLPVFTGQIGSEFMPQSDQNMVIANVDLQVGTRFETTVKTARKIEKDFKKLIPEMQLYATAVGSDDQASMSSIFIKTENNSFSIRCKLSDVEDRKRSVFDIANVIRKQLSTYPEVIKYDVTTDFLSVSTNTVNVDIYGYNFDETSTIAQNLINKFKKLKGAGEINFDRDRDRAELKVVCDKNKLAALGLSSSQVAGMVRNRINGMSVGYLKEDGNEYDIMVRYDENYRNSINKLEEFPLYSSMGKKVKLKEVASVEEYWCPPTINRKSRQRICTISLTPVGTSLGELAVAAKKIIDKEELPQDVSIDISGSYQDQQETFSNMGLLFLLIIFLVYVVMASQFESLTKPFMIMMSVPFAISGVIAALWISGTTFNIVGGMGVILLIGIVVKNGIVLVDYTNLLRDRGYELNKSIMDAGRSRLRPVLMTALTTLLGMLPMALNSSEGSEIWKPMGVVVIGGIVVSTVVTLIVVPILYSLISRHGERDKKTKEQESFVFMRIGDCSDTEK